MAKKHLKILAAALALALVLPACSSGGGSSEKSEPAASSSAQAEASSVSEASGTSEAAVPDQTGGKHLNAAIYWSAATIDPAVEYDGWTSCRAGITETLVTVNENLELVPLLADSWELKDDQVTWVMHIRDGVTFQNGKPVDAAAVKACFERTMGIQERAITACKIDHIEADGQTLTIVTSEPFGAFLANLSEPVYSVIDVESGTDPETSPIGTGPYMVTGYKAMEYIELAAYPGYWQGRPGVDTITLKTISDDHTRSQALQAGQIDIGQRINSTDVAVLQADADCEVYETAGTRVRVMIFNQKNPLLADYNIRKAIECCLRYDALTNIMGATYTMAGAPFPSSAPYGYNELDVQHYDPEKTAQCLKDAGYEDTDGDGYVDKDGKALELRLIHDDDSISAAMDAVMDMAKTAGIKLDVKKVDTTADAEHSGDYDIMIRNWQSLSTGDPQWLLDSMYKTGAMNNLSNYSSAEMDEICNKMTQAFTFEDRQALAIEAEKLILADSINVMMFGQNNFVMARKNVSNVKPYPIDYYFIDWELTID
ncbi:MAG: ABC transporter substrate-binding protein [Eubacterium sp.]|nr:ABC transporter substrate-binding protein [Eubacterium sp.]